MPETSAARADVLAHVRSAVARYGTAGERHGEHAEPAHDDGEGTDSVAAFCELLRELGAEVREATPATIRDAISEACDRHGARTAVIPADWPEAWVPLKPDVTQDTGLPAEVVAAFDVAITAARLGIAESGTVVFDGGPGQGRRILTLLPGLHICVLRVSSVVSSISAGMALLRPQPGTPDALTLVSGPSATTDIELTRIKGVHGPRDLVLILLDV